MNTTRISQIGRKLIESSTIDEKGLPFATKPGFSFGVSTRSVPKQWDYTQVKLWPRCSYVPLT